MVPGKLNNGLDGGQGVHEKMSEEGEQVK